MTEPNEVEMWIDPEGYKVCEMCEEQTPVSQIKANAIGLICYVCLSQNQHLAGEYY